MLCVVKCTRLDYKGKSYNQGEKVDVEEIHVHQALKNELVVKYEPSDTTQVNITENTTRPKKGKMK